MPTACRKVTLFLVSGVYTRILLYGMQEREKMFAQR